MTSTTWRALTWAGSLGACLLTAHAVTNLRALPEPETDPAPVQERVSVLLPANGSVPQMLDCLESLQDQTGVPDLEILVLGDPDRPGAADTVRVLTAADPRIRLIPPDAEDPAATPLSALAAAATGGVLVLLDPSVQLAPHALAALVGLLRTSRLDLLSALPRQLAQSPADRLLHPLLTWFWLVLRPWRTPAGSARHAPTVLDGQLLIVDADAYRRWEVPGSPPGPGPAPGDAPAPAFHDAPDDLVLARAARRSGARSGTAAGSRIAISRRYPDGADLRAGYTTRLRALLGTRGRATAAVLGLGLTYLVPPLAALRGSTVGLVGYAAAATGRYLVAERTGGRSLPDSLAHPAAVGALVWLTATSWWDRRVATGGVTTSTTEGTA
ncbi:MAG: glycosyltransferase [Kineosporiaceae bacterium]